ncbi:MAG: alpha-amylase family glycosyl hydrolase [Saprospiraceae bacterium]|nr:alpha-amylase family glycosyl hydrolase [Saprospiraceae bacterium]
MKYIYYLIFYIVFFFFSCENKDLVNNGVSKEDAKATYVKTVPEWSKNATMYEVNIRQYSKEGTFKAFQKDLKRIKDLGIDILWFMPIHPIGQKNRKGTEGSYYSVKDYKAVHADYGTIEDFKALVKEAHNLGMHVIIDWVANHTAFDNVWVEESHKDWYTLDSTGNLQPPIGTDWWDVADLNYENSDMRAAMIDALAFWVRECDIDGYRCDVADWVPIDFWNEARAELDKVKPVFMLAEAENPEHHKKAFDMSYGWEFHFIMNEIAEGKKSVKDIRNYLSNKAKKFQKDAYRLHFTSNHDENSWKGTVKERLGDATKIFAVLSATMEGMPLIYNGQECSLDKRLEFFEKDPIEWQDCSMTEFYKPLLKLNKDNEALWNGNYGGSLNLLSPPEDTIGFAFSRTKGDNEVFCIFNFSNKTRTVEYNNESLSGEFKELFDNSILNSKVASAELDPWGYLVFFK